MHATRRTIYARNPRTAPRFGTVRTVGGGVTLRAVYLGPLQVVRIRGGAR